MADFTYAPDSKYTVKPSYKVLQTDFENRYKVRRLKSSTKLRVYELEFLNRSSTEMTAVNTFFDTKKESLTSFTINIDGADVTGIFQEDSFWYRREAADVYSYGFTFEEVIA